MNENFKDLVFNFKKIAKKRWIKGVSCGHGNIGLTFEHELGKKVDSDYLPDYKDIEIKCTTRYSRFPISLFSVAFDGPTDKEIIRLNTKYGTFDKDFKNKKCLLEKIRYNEIVKLPNNYHFSLEINDDKLYLCVYDNKYNLIEKVSYVYLETIKEHLLTKLSNLAVIKASKKVIDNSEYFRYYQLNIYTLKDYNTFIDLLKQGIIEISLISRMNKSGEKAGKYSNKNLVFQINKSNILKLFNEIFYFNYDSFENYNEIQFL